MIRKLSFITALLLAVSAGCGRNGAAYQEDGQDTAAACGTEESFAETSDPPHSAFEEKFSIIPGLRLGMTEEEAGEVYKSRYTRSTENLSGSGPRYIRYTAPFESCPYFDTDMEGYELLSFTEDGILSAVSCHFGSQSPDMRGKADHTEAELREVYDMLFRAASGKHGEPVRTDNTVPGVSSALWLEAPYELDIMYCSDEEKGLCDVYVSAVDREALVNMIAPQAQERTPDRQ